MRRQARRERAGSARIARIALAVSAASALAFACDSSGGPAPGVEAASPDPPVQAAASAGPGATASVAAPSFAVPDARTRVRAAGARAGLAADLRDAFAPGPGFIPIAAPHPGDWLAEHREPGQTYDQFVASRPNRPGAGGRRTIYIVPLGDLGPRRAAAGPAGRLHPRPLPAPGARAAADRGR